MAIFRPRPGLVLFTLLPMAHAMGYFLPPSGLPYPSATFSVTA
jgi:hypothetical protein